MFLLFYLNNFSNYRQFSGFKWLDKESLEQKVVETITDTEYTNFISAMERLCNLPYSYRIKDFIFTFLKPLMSQMRDFVIPKLQYDSDGRAFITTYGKYKRF